MHLTEQTDQPRPSVFGKCWASCNNGVNVIPQKYGKGGGRGGRTSLQQLEFYFDASLFVCFLLLLFFRLFCLRLFVCFLFLLQSRKQLQHGWNIVLQYLLFLFAFVCSTCIYCTIISTLVERHFEIYCSRPNNYGAAIQWFRA